MTHARVSPSSLRDAITRRRRLADDSGFTVVEVMVAIFILTVAILGALTLVNTSNLTALSNKARTGAVNLARQVQEGARAVPATVAYAQLSTGCPAPSSLDNPCPTSSSLVAALQAQPGLAPDASSPAGVWQITRENITYTVKVAICSMDDPTDGYGSHTSGGPYCSDATAGATDSQPDDYKRVSVDVTWANTRGNNDVRATALIQSSGTNGPAVTCLRQTGSPCPSSSTITSSSTTSISFTATITGASSTLEWFVDGNFKGTATPSSGTATFTWNLGTVGSGSEVFDGTYEVSAIAYNANGNAGTLGTVQVTVNRQAPAAIATLTGGRDTEIETNGTIGGVDLDWLPLSDQDLLYYRVYRAVWNGSWVTTLEHQTADAGVTAWTDTTLEANPNSWGGGGCSDPPPSDPNAVYYYVVGVDSLNGAPREGTAVTGVDINGCNHKPKNVGGFSKTVNADGTVTFTWSQPSNPLDPDGGDTIIGYRIYRWPKSLGNDETVPTHRIEYVLGASTLSWTDVAPRPGGVVQLYCVRAVDKKLQESDNCSGDQEY